MHAKSSSSTTTATVFETKTELKEITWQELKKELQDDGSIGTAEEYKERLAAQLAKMALKDQTSTRLTKQDIDVVYEDEHVVVVNKPAGVLTVPGKIQENPSLNEIMYDTFGCEMKSMDMMVTHRLGMDTSGLIVFVKTLDGLRGMNTVFRTRKIERKYEALVCGHVLKDSGVINLPIMRDYEFPPYVRISTLNHQRALLNYDPEDVDKKILELPKDSITKYEVLDREYLDDENIALPVTRLLLTSISGRTHQLNCHLAAFGHPIVGDDTYGLGGFAALQGGLTKFEQDEMIPNPDRATIRLQKEIATAIATNSTRVPLTKGSATHAASLKFRHPLLKEDIELQSKAPF